MTEYVKKGYKRKIDLLKAIVLYEARYSIRQIAQHFGVTKQAAHAALIKAGVHSPTSRSMEDDLPPLTDEEYSELMQQIGDRLDVFWQKRLRNVDVKEKAGQQARNAIAAGVLIPQPCEKCGANGETTAGIRAVHAHHDDYSKPLDVRWLCGKHHKEWHKFNKVKL